MPKRHAQVAAWLTFGAVLLIAGCNDPRASRTIARAESQIEAGDQEAALATLNARLESGAEIEPGAAAHLHYLRGTMREAVGREYEALYDYEHIVRELSATEHFTAAVEREFAIAKLIVDGQAPESIREGAASDSLWSAALSSDTSNDPAEDMAEELLIRTVERLPGSELSRKAMLELIRLYVRQGGAASAGTVASAMQKHSPNHIETVQAHLLIQQRFPMPPPDDR